MAPNTPSPTPAPTPASNSGPGPTHNLGITPGKSDSSTAHDPSKSAGKGDDAARQAGQRDREALRQAEEIGQTGQRPSAKDAPLTGSQLPSRPFAEMNSESGTESRTPVPTPVPTPGRDAGQAARRAGAETSDGAELTKPATERQVDDAVKESFPASDPTSTQREKPGAGDAPPDLRHRLPPTATDAERDAVEQAKGN